MNGPAGDSVTARVFQADKPTKVQDVDIGAGIAPGAIGRLPVTFEQVRGHTVFTNEGTCLGLYLTKKMAEMQVGELTIENELGVGTTVTVGGWSISNARTALTVPLAIAEHALATIQSHR